MWNYSFVFPDLILLIVFMVYYFARPRLPISMNKSFVCLLIVDMADLFFDVAASVALEHPDAVSPFVLRVLNAGFFFAFIFRIFGFYFFTRCVFYPQRKRSVPIAVAEHIVFVGAELLVLANLFCDTLFSISPTGVYSRSFFYNIIYVCAFYYLALSLIQLFYYRNKNRYDSFFSAVCFNLILLLGYSMRLLFPKYLIMNFFALVAILIIFISYENSLLYLAGKTNAFNKKALFSIFDELSAESHPLVLGFAIHNYNELRETYSSVQMDRAISLITQYFKKNHPKLLRFYLHDGRFVLIGPDSSKTEEIRKKIIARFARPWRSGTDTDVYLEPKFVQLDSVLLITNPHQIVTSIFSAFRDVEKLDVENLIVNGDSIKEAERVGRIKRLVEHAVESDSVEMFLQPIVRADDYSLIGAETLARIHDENGVLVPPVEFIPIAEKNGRINALGEQMFEKACQFVQTHDTEKLGISWINVNLSPLQFLRPDLSMSFSEILHAYDVPSEKIHLEITEESMIDYTLIQKQMTAMRCEGFKFVLDDYGSGYSNVARIKRCPFVNIKLDMEIVRNYHKEKDPLVPNMVQAFKLMGFTVTAEGVETLEMAEEMNQVGCDFLQGYYFAKPMPAEEFAKTYGKR